jgi:hypothetical protein
MLQKEIIAVYSDNHIKSIKTFCGQNTDIMNSKVPEICSKKLQEELTLHNSLSVLCIMNVAGTIN